MNHVSIIYYIFNLKETSFNSLIKLQSINCTNESKVSKLILEIINFEKFTKQIADLSRFELNVFKIILKYFNTIKI